MAGQVMFYCYNAKLDSPSRYGLLVLCTLKHTTTSVTLLLLQLYLVLTMLLLFGLL